MASSVLTKFMYKIPGKQGIVHRSIQTGKVSFRPSSQFEAAKERVTKLSEEPDNDVKLRLYALFKQSTVGPCNIPKPGIMDFVGKAKWQAWNDIRDLTQNDAEAQYITLVDDLVSNDTHNTEAVVDGNAGNFETLSTTLKDSIYRITLNRPSKLNAINYKMYEELICALKEAENDKSCKAALTTGAGDFYSTGNDITNFAEALKAQSSISVGAKMGGELLNRFVSAFIDFPKPLIGLINGPAVGISATVLGLYDAIYASDRATFHMPFTNLALTPEGCSSYTFPRVMGYTKACGVLLFNQKLDAQEAYDRGLVNEVIPHDSFHHVVESKLTEISRLPIQSLMESKRLVRDAIRSDLHDTNRKECDALVERWQSKECMDAIVNFAKRKS